MTARTTWRAKPCGWRDRERVVALGDEFGPAGPLVLDVLEELSKEQRDDDGVRSGLRSLSRAAFLPRGTEGITLAREILAFAATVGALDDLNIADDADMTVTCRVSGFTADQGKGYESVRKGWQRSGHRPENGDNAAACPETGDSVPVCPPTGQDRTEEQPPKPPASGGPQSLPPTKPSGNRKTELDTYRAELQTWVQAHFPGCEPSAVEGVVGWVRSRGGDPTPTACREFVASAPNFAHVLEPAA